MKKILFISSLFPNRSVPNFAPYNRQQLLSLSNFCEIDAVVPIPWFSIPKYKRYRSEDRLGKVKVFHPIYFYTPLILRSFYGYFYYWSIYRLIKRLSIENNYDCIFSSWLYPDAWAATILAQKLKLPLFVSVLGTDVNRLKQGDRLIERSLMVGNYASKIICVSNALKDRLDAIGFQRKNLIYLQNGIDKNIFYPRNKQEIRSAMSFAKDDKIILFVGNLKKEKGLLELVKAFSLLIEHFDQGKTHLFIVGGGSFCINLKKIVADLGISSNVNFMGQKSSAEIAMLMNACDILCLPSYSEGQPNVVIEALNCHTKVVSTNVGGIPELNTGKNNMILVEPRDHFELEKALSDMLRVKESTILWQSFNDWNYNALSLYNVFKNNSTGY